MATSECAEFLQWALPRLGMRWEGFRRVHRQVCKRIGRRLQELRLPGPAAYRRHLESHPEEWDILDSFCRISTSRFRRDRIAFDRLAGEVLLHLAGSALARSDRELRCWSAGCASGEEPYTLSILWKLELSTRFSGLSLAVVATDVDPQLLERARLARYRRSSLKELPVGWIEAAFTGSGEWFLLRPEFREAIEFRAQDIRESPPKGPFDLIFCRNLAFTYFDQALQLETLERALGVLRPGGALVIGLKERLPQGASNIKPWLAEVGIYRRVG